MATSLRKSGIIPSDCTACKARLHGLCEPASGEILPAMATVKAGDRRIKAGQDLFALGEPCDAVYSLVEGWVFLYNILEDGRQQILHFGLPGSVLGFHPSRNAPMTYGVRALTDAVVCVTPRENLHRLLTEHPEFAMRLAWLMSRDRELSFGRLTSIGRHCARERVAHLLLELFVRCRAQWPGVRREEMHLPLTQEHIGDATGLTGVHVNRVLRDLKKDGIVEFHYRRLRILDPDRLVDVAGIDPHLLLPWTWRQPPEQNSRRPIPDIALHAHAAA